MGLFPFTHRRKIGLVDAKGQVHAGPSYDAIGPLREDRRVFKRVKYGFLDAAGSEVVPERFIFASDFAFGAAMASETAGLYGLVGPDGSWKLAGDFGWIEAVSATLAVAHRNTANR